MSRASVWKRLLWKEYREGRWVALIALLAPALCFPIAQWYVYDSWQRGLFALPGAAGVHLAVALWAAGRGAGKREGSEFARSHLPVHPFMEWLASFVVPILVTGALGCWFGFWSGKVAPSYRAVSTVQAGALDLATTYAICYLISAIVSSWAAIMFAAFRVAAGTLINVWNLSPMTEADVVWFVGRTALGALAGSLVFTALAQKKSLAFRQAASLLLFVAVIFVPMIGNLDTGWLFPKTSPHQTWGGKLVSAERAVNAYNFWNARAVKRGELISPQRRPGKGSWFRCVNHRAETLFEREFPSRTTLLDIAGERWVFLASQPECKGPITIMGWDSTTNRVRNLARIPVRGIVLDTDFGHVSRDGGHLVMITRSMIGNGFDLWLVDLRSGRSRIAIPCGRSFYNEQAVFLRDRVIVVDLSMAVTINYRTLVVKPLRIPSAMGEEDR